jgi:serine/threonine protein kinase
MIGTTSLQDMNKRQYYKSFVSFAQVQEEIQRQSYDVKPEEILSGCKLGEGSMAEVFEATFRGQKCAAKRLKNGVAANSVQFNDLLSEVHTLASIGSHPNIITFYGACVREDCRPGKLLHLIYAPILESKSQRIRSDRSVILP